MINHQGGRGGPLGLMDRFVVSDQISASLNLRLPFVGTSKAQRFNIGFRPLGRGRCRQAPLVRHVRATVLEPGGTRGSSARTPRPRTRRLCARLAILRSKHS